MVVDTSTTSQNLDFQGETNGAFSTIQYGITYVKSGPDQEDRYLSRGDVIKVLFNTSSAVEENKKVRIKIVPRVGQATIVDFTTPDVMTDQRITLWP